MNALPVVLKSEPVPALEIAASDAGTTVPSRPWPNAPTLRIVVRRRRASHYKHTQHIRFAIGNRNSHRRGSSDAAAETAWLMIVCTSPIVKLPAVALGMYRIRRTRRGHSAGIIGKSAADMAHRDAHAIAGNAAITDSHQHVADIVHAWR